MEDNRYDDIMKCLQKKVSQKVVWILFVAIGLPLLVTGIRVWSQQESDHLRYAGKSELAIHEKRITRAEVIADNVIKDIAEIKTSQSETRKDIKEILKYMRR